MAAGAARDGRGSSGARDRLRPRPLGAGTRRRHRAGSGSIIVVLATDAPLLPHQCNRLAQRAGLGVARVGGGGGHSSGDLFLAFATGNRGATARARRATPSRAASGRSPMRWISRSLLGRHRGDRGGDRQLARGGRDDDRARRPHGAGDSPRPAARRDGPLPTGLNPVAGIESARTILRSRTVFEREDDHAIPADAGGCGNNFFVAAACGGSAAAPTVGAGGVPSASAGSGPTIVPVGGGPASAPAGGAPSFQPVPGAGPTGVPASRHQRHRDPSRPRRLQRCRDPRRRNPDRQSNSGPGTAYVVYARKSAADGGIEFDVFAFTPLPSQPRNLVQA